MNLLSLDLANNSGKVCDIDALERGFGQKLIFARGFPERAAVVNHPGNEPPYIRVIYPAGCVGQKVSGAAFALRLPPPVQSIVHYDLTLSYAFRMADDFDFKLGGKLPGLAGGMRPSGGNSRSDGFTARMMWRENGALMQYIYYPGQRHKFGKDIAYLDKGKSCYVVPGRWHKVKHRVRLNKPGRPNGRLQAWLDNVLVADESAIAWRDVGHSFTGIDKMHFSTFFGGSSQDWAPQKDQYIDFKDIKVERSSMSEACFNDI